jgi:nicotinamide mononucleotide adenylyltransferase
MKYILVAKERCDFLWIGITQYNIRNLKKSPADPHRQENFHNPFTYFERVEMIKGALLDSGFSLRQFDIIPFPIDEPNLLQDFLPINVTIFTTIYDDWNKHKIEILKKQGYKVEILWEDSIKAVEGINIRNQIAIGDNKWEKNVPAATIDVVKKYEIRERLIFLRG